MCCGVKEGSTSPVHHNDRKGISPCPHIVLVTCVVAFVAIALLARFGILKFMGTTPAYYLQFAAFGAAGIALIAEIIMIVRHCSLQKQQKKQEVSVSNRTKTNQRSQPPKVPTQKVRSSVPIITKKFNLSDQQPSKPACYTVEAQKEELEAAVAHYLNWEKKDYERRGLGYPPVREANLICPYKKE